MNEMELVTDVPVIEMELDVVTRNYPVIPNPEGTPTDDISSMEIDNVIYAVKDEEARTELENKVDKEEGKGLSEEDFTHTLKAKLDGIENGAEVNVQSDFAQSDNSADDFIKNKPTKLSDFSNDEGFVDKSVNDLENYYKKSEVNSALDLKVDKVNGKGLSTNDYDDTAKGIVDNVTTNLATKVDKDGDKVLSDNNYSDTDKSIVGGVTSALADKVDKVEGYGLSQNDYSDEEKSKVGEIDNKLDKTENAIRSDALAIISPVNDNAPYIYRQTPVKESFKALMKKIVGASVVWNQLAPQITSANYVENVNASTTFSNNKVTCVCVGGTAGIYQNTNSRFSITGHKYLISIVINTEQAGSFQIGFGNIGGSKAISDTNKDMRFAIVQSATADGTALVCYKVSSSENDTFTVSKYNAVDLTAMFGTTIADYVNTLETSQSGSGIAWLQSYGFFTEDYYAYKQNKLESGCVSAKKIYGFNVWDGEWESGVYKTYSASGNGAKEGASGYTRCKNLIPIKPNIHYYFLKPDTVGDGGIGFYDKNGTYLGYSLTTGIGSTGINHTDFTSPNGAYYMSIYKAQNMEGACLNLYDVAKNGTYEPYVEPTTYPISPIIIRGLLGLSYGKLTVNGDEYNADGSVTRKYGIVVYDGSEDEGWNKSSLATEGFYIRLNSLIKELDYRNLMICDSNKLEVFYNQSVQAYREADNGVTAYRDANNSYPNQNWIYVKVSGISTSSELKTWLSNNPITVIYVLATPTTEQTTPFTETEIVSSTEEFIDYEVAQGNRDVAIPVGTDTDYYQEMKLPSLPTMSGNHNLIYNIATGFGWS